MLAPQNLPSAYDRLASVYRAYRPETEVEAHSAAGTLSKGRALVGLFGSSIVREFEVRFIGATEYKVFFKNAGTNDWTEDGDVGNIARDGVFKSAKAFFLSEWWKGTFATGDKFYFEADPEAKMVMIPVLFQLGYDPRGNPVGADALTSNGVNVFVDGENVIAAKAFGPKVNLGQGQVDILEYYMRQMYQRAGFTAEKVKFVDARQYHDTKGSVHCASNAQRTIPDVKWWTVSTTM